jgi:ComF family protein
MLHLLKFEGVRSVAAPLGEKLAGAVAMIEADARQDSHLSEMLVIAVPLHASRTKQRGYNQSILMADVALRMLRNQFPEWKLTAAHGLLVRHRATEILFPLTSAARREMLRGAFRCTEPAAIAGKAVLLVDDIMTTGTTARECTKTLLEAGAKSVHVATLARAQKVTTAKWDEAEEGLEEQVH